MSPLPMFEFVFRVNKFKGYVDVILSSIPLQTVLFGCYVVHRDDQYSINICILEINFRIGISPIEIVHAKQL